MPTISATGPLISRDAIRMFVNDLVNRFHPSRVILFGSYAYGNPNPDSDVDLLVIMRHRAAGPKVAARIMLACPHHFPVDLLVRSPTEIRDRINMGDTFLREVTSKGVLLHEADNARMGR
jgi:predicted nucleotidyltransferase